MPKMIQHGHTVANIAVQDEATRSNKKQTRKQHDQPPPQAVRGGCHGRGGYLTI